MCNYLQGLATKKKNASFLVLKIYFFFFHKFCKKKCLHPHLILSFYSSTDVLERACNLVNLQKRKIFFCRVIYIFILFLIANNPILHSYTIQEDQILFIPFYPFFCVKKIFSFGYQDLTAWNLRKRHKRESNHCYISTIVCHSAS